MLIFDGNNFLWRAAFSGRGLISRGRPTGALYISLSMLAALPSLFTPQQVIFLWDSRESWRRKILSQYKRNRKSTDDVERTAVYKQMDSFREVLDGIGVIQHQVEKLEADDLAGILTTNLLKSGRKVTLVSGDKDWFQLLGPGVTQVRGWQGKKKDVWTEKRFQETYHVSPQDWPRYLALVGDTSDNIPNAQRGIGPVAALKVMRGEFRLTEGGQRQYEQNLKVTPILRAYPSAFNVNPKYALRNRKILEDVISEFELFSLSGEQDHIWEVGGWRDPK